MDFISNAKEELIKVQKMKSNMELTLENLPEGRLHAIKSSGRIYYYLRDGSETDRYIGTEDNELVRQLKARKFAERSLSAAKKDEKLLLRLIDGYESLSPERIMSAIPQTYWTESPDYIEGIDFVSAEEWANAPYRKSCSYLNQLTHTTLKGDLVRSKSEAIIANLLFSKNIPYRYEEEIEIAGRIFTPDFIVAVSGEGRVKILEHAGMMSNREYRNAFAWKVSQYIASGFMPLDNLFITYDDMDGNINTKLIESVIDTYFL